VILILKIICTHNGIPYCERMEGTRFVKLAWWWPQGRPKHVAIKL